ncbi:hypothetical protein SAMN02745116_02635, partial [Pilibacter termitis]
AKLMILDYTGLETEEWENVPVLAMYQRQLAKVLENRAGVEGETSRSEGDISRNFEEGLIPKSIRQSLSKYVKTKVVGL